MQHFFIPAKIHFGTGCIAAHAQDVSAFGTKALIVTGARSALLSGALDAVTTALKEHHIQWELFDEVHENPLLSTVTAGARRFLNSGCDFFIGIGGGSPIDAAKAMSAMAKCTLKGQEIYNASLITDAWPIVAIPTTSGTGTEATPYSIVSDDQRGIKAGVGAPVLFPTISFCDPTFTTSLPQKQTRDTAIDALSHLLEGIYSRKRSTLLYPLIFDGIKRIVTCLPKALEHPEDIDLRHNLMQASLYGGMVIAHTGTTLQHSIGYPLTSELGTAHGLANGVVMQPIMELYYPAVRQELNDLFRWLSMNKDDFYSWLAQFNMKLETPVTDEFTARRAEEVVNSRNMANNPFDVDITTVKALYKSLR